MDPEDIKDIVEEEAYKLRKILEEMENENKLR